MKQPTPAQIIKAREKAGLTQREAADLMGVAAYQRWSEWERGANINVYMWELFLLRTGQHPKFTLTKKA